MVASTAEEDHTGEYHTGDSASSTSVQSSSPFTNDGNGVRGSHGAATLDPTEPPPRYAAFVFEQSIVKRPATIAMSCSLIALAIGVALFYRALKLQIFLSETIVTSPSATALLSSRLSARFSPKARRRNFCKCHHVSMWQITKGRVGRSTLCRYATHPNRYI